MGKENKGQLPMNDHHKSQRRAPLVHPKVARELYDQNKKLKRAIRGIDLPGWKGPDTLEMAAERLEDESPILARLLRQTAQLQRDTLREVERDV